MGEADTKSEGEVESQKPDRPSVGYGDSLAGHGDSLLESINYNFYKEYAIRGFAPCRTVRLLTCSLTGLLSFAFAH